MSKKDDSFFLKKSVWAEVKDALFGCYFKPYISKILHTHRPIFYVDCFAGKGKFDDDKKGSPLIALDIIHECQKASYAQDSQIQSFFIELNYADVLQSNVSGYNNVRVISGRYEDNIETLLHGKQNHNVFLYIDPYGIKALNCELFDKFSSNDFNSIELLINLNSFGFIREACRALGTDLDDVEPFDEIQEYEPSFMDSSEKSKKELTDIAGGEYWRKIIEDYKENHIDGYEAEVQFSVEYCKRLQKSYKYVLNMPIRLKERQRPKYRMVHATNHEDGCILMNDNICKRWEVLKLIQSDGQIKIFDETVENKTVNINEIRTRLKTHLSKYKTNTKLNIILAEFFTNNGILCPSGDVKKILKEFETNGNIEVTRKPALTKTGKPTTFFTQNSDQTIMVRRKL